MASNINIVGRVKWFSSQRGYGFITDEKTNEDYFVHYTQIEEKGFATLRDNQKVIFNIGQNKKGYCATCVRKVIFP